MIQNRKIDSLEFSRKVYFRTMAITTCFVVMTQNGLSWPTIVFFGKQFGASASFLGWAVSSFLAVQLISVPLWTALSDRIGRKPVLLIGLAGSALAMAVMAFAQSLEWIFVSRILSGIFGANIALIGACAADVATPEERTKIMGQLEAAATVGQLIVGPLLGGLLSEINLSVPYLFASILGIANLTYAYLRIDEPKSDLKWSIRTNLVKVSLLNQYRKVYSEKNVLGCILIMFIIGVALGPLDVCYALILKDKLGFSPKDISLLLVFLGLMVISLQLYAIPKFSKKIGEQDMISVGTMFLSVAMLMLASIGSVLPSQLWVAVTEKMVYAFGFAAIFSPLASIVAGNAPADVKSTAIGLFRAANSLGRIAAPLGAFIYEAYGSAVTFLAISVLFTFASVLTSTWRWRLESATLKIADVTPLTDCEATTFCPSCGQSISVQIETSSGVKRTGT